VFSASINEVCFRQYRCIIGSCLIASFTIDCKVSPSIEEMASFGGANRVLRFCSF
jgi:hypothetical protein